MADTQKLFNKSGRSKQWIFSVVSSLFVLVLAGFIVYASGFLVSHLNEAVNTDVKAGPTVKFDIEEFEKLNLLKK